MPNAAATWHPCGPGWWCALDAVSTRFGNDPCHQWPRSWTRQLFSTPRGRVTPTPFATSSERARIPTWRTRRGIQRRWADGRESLTSELFWILIDGIDCPSKLGDQRLLDYLGVTHDAFWGSSMLSLGKGQRPSKPCWRAVPIWRCTNRPPDGTYELWGSFETGC